MPCIGGYSDFKAPDETSDAVLHKVSDQLIHHPYLKDFELGDILDNYKYTKQVVAGTNYKFITSLQDVDHEIVVWHKLNGEYKLTSVIR